MRQAVRAAAGLKWVSLPARQFREARLKLRHQTPKPDAIRLIRQQRAVAEADTARLQVTDLALPAHSVTGTTDGSLSCADDFGAKQGQYLWELYRQVFCFSQDPDAALSRAQVDAS